MNGKRYFNEIKKKYANINYFQSCIIILLQNHHGSVLQRDLDEADHLQSQLRVLSLKPACPISPSLNRLTHRLTVLTSTH